MFVWKTIKYQLYLLQLENYELVRYFKLLLKKGFFAQKKQRKELVWTAKVVFILALAVLLHFTVAVYLFYSRQYVLGAVVFLLLFEAYFFLFAVAAVLLWPVDWSAKFIIIARAKSRIKDQGSRIKVIGIAGSYGKTTMKEVLKQVLGARFKVLAAPESVNTPVGIARWILNSVAGETDILIVEMGEHYRGDVAEICRLAPPDVAVVTGINEAHLERMKTLENITATVFEVVSQAKPGALVLLNGDDSNVMAHYKEYVWPDHKVKKFQISNFKFQRFNQGLLSWAAQIDPLGEVEVRLLGEYALADADAAIQIALSLGMGPEEIEKGIAKIKPVEHRLQPIKPAGEILVIDDAYNGNPAGAAEAIRVLSRFEGRRKIYITPGLVETGRQAEEVHKKIGQELASVADLVILIKNSVTPFIAEGLKTAGYASEEIVWFNTVQAAHGDLKNILRPGDVILFQNDWGDQYL